MQTHSTAPWADHRAIVWLDRQHALVARSDDGHARVSEVERAFDPEDLYLLRVLREAGDCDRVMVMGPEVSRLAFEREFVALYRRPDRLIDAPDEVAPATSELIDLLRLMEPERATG